ncbi:hypothetical protein EVAR_77564_1 [Eumeta japonica]|uniref:Uncharacterized protein n=1 Tax=Eumeta variegata TaxID=151549 RepID=A0A4C1T7H6_EUMVA|nr:hypothetical protein EVAR_77564_1 [Eumeta japonica]
MKEGEKWEGSGSGRTCAPHYTQDISERQFRASVGGGTEQQTDIGAQAYSRNRDEEIYNKSKPNQPKPGYGPGATEPQSGISG